MYWRFAKTSYDDQWKSSGCKNESILIASISDEINRIESVMKGRKKIANEREKW
jgi:hypothetical protein